MPEDLLTRPAVELAELVRRRRVSPVELTEAALRRIERLDVRVNSFATIDAEGALDTARNAEAAAGSAGAPPFLGVPTAIKDLHLTRGIRTTFGTGSMEDFVPDIDEENVARLRRAGFVFLGKTNVPEFGTVPYTESRLLGATRNPWSEEHSPGGSSGGAAAAVAAGFVPVAHASDGAGSIRIPASACGLFGIKPARGRVSSAPLFGEQIGGLSTAGPITRHVVDAAAMLDVMQGYVAGDPNWAPPPVRPYAEAVREDPPTLRVGLALSTPLHTYGGEALRVAHEAGALLEGLGHTAEPVDLPVTDDLVDDFTLLWTARLAALPVDPETLEPYNRDLYHRGAARSAPDLVRALTSVHLHARAIVRAALEFDVVLAPTLTRSPLRLEAFAHLGTDETFAANLDYVGLTPLANLTGLPAINLPLGVSGDGLPMGVQVVGGPGGEAALFSLAGQVQRAADWTERRPILE